MGMRARTPVIGPPRAFLSRGTVERLCMTCVRSGLRQQNCERGSLAWCRLYFNLSIVHLYRAEDHRQSDAAAPLLGREVQVKYTLEIFGLDPNAGVGHRDFGATSADR